MKRLVLIFFAICSLVVNAQQYNNEWIDYNKTYYKFKVGSTGLHRVPQSALAAIGLANTEAAHVQLWRNGVEVPIYTSAQTGIIPAGGFIEFWGEINDGKPDNQLYRNTLDQINNTRSLFTDTAAYFLTINSVGANKRLVPTANQIPPGATPEPYFLYTRTIPFNEAIHFGRPEGSGSGALYTASYEQGKGWASTDIANGQSRAFTENLFPYLGGGAPDLQVRLNIVGNAPNNRNVQLSINGNSVFDQLLGSFNYARLVKSLPASTLKAGNDFVISNAAPVSDRVRVALVELTYARTFNFGGASSFRFQIPANSTGKYVEITGFTFSGIPVLYDLSNGRRYEVDPSNPSLLKIFLQPSSAVQDLVLVSQDAAAIKTVQQFETRNFINYLTPANQGDYLMITHHNILNGQSGAKPVEEYRTYRASAAGGSYNAKVYMIDQLIDQFAFGIKNDPMGVRNFTSWARNKFSVLPKQVFIAAKAVNYYAARINEAAYSADISRLNLVPTMGYPGSDILLTSEGSSSVPLTPVGRLSIVNGDELSVYLNKVKQYESALNNPSPLISESAWKKNVIHMVGANDQPTIDLLYSLLGRPKAIVEDTSWGAFVSEFVKSYNTGTQQTLSERLTDLINKGIGLLSYFGHSSATTLDFNLDDPMNYNNSGKYPLFNMMGCSVGDIFGLTSARISAPDVLSEKYVLAKDRGAIGMLAGTSLGYVNTLDFYNIRFYENLSTVPYSKTIGELMKRTIESVFEAAGEPGQLQRSQCEEYALNGDPAIRLYQFDKPDYAIEDQLVNVSPAFVSIAETDFKVGLKIMNLGKAISQKLVVEVKRTYPDLSTSLIKRDTIEGIRYVDSVSFSIPIDPTKDKGANKITVTIDPDDAVSELYETNNSVTKNVFIFEDELRPVYPYNYAIINKQGIKFSASTANPLATSRNYLFELDTTELFNSPLKITQNKTSLGGVVEFNPVITFRDSMVYYWRVGSKPFGNETVKWNNASFIYISGAEVGFNQSHYFQFLKNVNDGVFIDNNRNFLFDSLKGRITITNAIRTATNIIGARDIAMYNIGDVLIQGGYSGPEYPNTNLSSLRFYVINNKTLIPVNNEIIGSKGKYGSYLPVEWRPGYTVQGFFQFDISTLEARKAVMDFMDSIPFGYYVSLTSNQWSPTVLPAVWAGDTSVLGKGTSLYHKMKLMGLTELDRIQTEVPFIFVYQKGNTAPLAQVIGNSINDKLKIELNLPLHGISGFVKSPVFQTATSWSRLEWHGAHSESAVSDSVSVSIIGVNKSGQEALLLTNIAPSQKNIDLSSINAATYPGLRIVMQSVDSADRSPYQLKYWRLYGQPAPEGSITPNIYFSMKDTLDIGEPLNFGVAFKNISRYNFSDSLKVKLTVRDKNNSENILTVANQKALIAGDTIKLNVPVPSNRFTGNNSLFVEFNPANAQAEQFHFNNFIYKDFYVRGDSSDPYLDVTFDGLHILNKDIVSAKPDILIKLTDDAKWLPLNSTDLIKVQLKYPDGVLRDFNFNNDTLVFRPASTTGENTATVNFKPYLAADGNYELIVSAKDQSGNTAGDMQYKVAFQVINKPMISNLLNYPNPFTTSTAFVFTLTGSEIPQNIRIQILTITGKIVKEIIKNELGPLRIGRNITEYKWDGTDQYGQKLANGVYLYRVITNLNNRALDKYTAPNDNTDKYFNKGYGKMYLMR